MILPPPNELDRLVWNVQAETAKAILAHESMPQGQERDKLVLRLSRRSVWHLVCDPKRGPRLIDSLRRLIPLDSMKPRVVSEWWWMGCIAGSSGPRDHLLDGDVPALIEMLHSIVCESVLADLRGG